MLLLTFLLAPLANALPGPTGIGKLPALGWNSWNAYGCQINEKKFLDAAQLIVSSGLAAAGYEYVNIDDCWSQMSRDNVTSRLDPDFNKFPDGINGTAQKIHDLGLKIGIYSSAGTKTCAGYPASLGFEDLDAQTWADWGIDYLKYDNCNIPTAWKDECDWCIVDEDNHMSFKPGPNGTCPANASNWCPMDYDWSRSRSAERYRRMQKAIDKTGRPILYSLCEWGTANVQSWGYTVAQSWRSTGDINPQWPRILEILNENSFFMNYVNFYGHSDPDMLEVGNIPQSITVDAETRSHFAFWAAMKSPLLIGTNLANLSNYHLSILKNPYLLAFNQDPTYGAPAAPYKWGTNPNWTFNATRPAEYWSGQYEGGLLILVLNSYNYARNMTIKFSEVPRMSGASYKLRNVWTDEDIDCVSDRLDVEIGPHDTAAFVAKESCIYTDN